MVVIGIIGLLAALLLPQVLKSAAGAKQAPCINNLQQIYLALQQYAGDNRGNLPWAGKGKAPWDHLQILVDKGYIKEPEVFVCPASQTEKPAVKDSKKMFKLSSSTCSYTTYDKPFNFNSPETDTILLADRDLEHYHQEFYCYIRADHKGAKEKATTLPKGLIDCSKFTSSEEGEEGATKDKTGEEEE
jgi:type II secretory pathway pseudopilin PulG